jgi:uncharacterized protein YlxW (UPF0749 family)
VTQKIDLWITELMLKPGSKVLLFAHFETEKLVDLLRSENTRLKEEANAVPTSRIMEELEQAAQKQQTLQDSIEKLTESHTLQGQLLESQQREKNAMEQGWATEKEKFKENETVLNSELDEVKKGLCFW